MVENEYPWLCSLKYRNHHICGVTLISGPPHHTILVGAAHCFTAGDNVENYMITCGEHSLRGVGRYEVNLQVKKSFETKAGGDGHWMDPNRFDWETLEQFNDKYNVR